MTTFRPLPAGSHNFSRAFEQMCGFAAIAQFSTFADTLDQLVLHCLVTFSNDVYREAAQVSDSIYALAGLKLPNQRIQMSLDLLVGSGQLVRQSDGAYLVPDAVRRVIGQRIESARYLERQVSEQWQEEIAQAFPDIAPPLAWKALSKYLTESFRRHGLQAAALLDPSVEVNGQGGESLTQILRKVIGEHFPEEQHSQAHAALSSFLAGGSHKPQRSGYIAQLGDGAFSYFSLTVAPEIAEEFRKQLKPLILFLDTNFLFGILNLHSSPHVDVSHDLLISREKYKLPFNVCYLYFVTSLIGAVVVESPLADELVNGKQAQPIEHVPMDRCQRLATAIRPRGKKRDAPGCPAARAAAIRSRPESCRPA